MFRLSLKNQVKTENLFWFFITVRHEIYSMEKTKFLK
jgi:hypothetical protein